MKSKREEAWCNELIPLLFWVYSLQSLWKLGVTFLYCSHWKKLIKKVDNIKASNNFVTCNMKGSSHKNSPEPYKCPCPSETAAATMNV
jgi:hypothetical protein